MTRSALELIQRTIDPPHGRAWHGGPTPLDALRGVSAADARRVPGPKRHSIWALALHIAYWNYAVRRRLEGGEGARFPRRPANWPAVPARADEAAWKADRALLEVEHRRLSATIAKFPPAKLNRRPPGGRKWTYAELVIGVLVHDAYHAGQIQLLKRLLRR